MKKIYKYTISLAISLLIFGSFFVMAYASSPMVLNRTEVSSNRVSVGISDVNYEIKSFEVDLQIEGDVSFSNIYWSEALNSPDVKKSYLYNGGDKTLKIQVTSNQNIVSFGSLDIGTVEVKGDHSTEYDIKFKSSLEFVYSDRNRTGSVVTLPSNTEQKFRYVDNSEPPEVPNPDKPIPEEDTQTPPSTGGSSSQGQSLGSQNTSSSSQSGGSSSGSQQISSSSNSSLNGSSSGSTSQIKPENQALDNPILISIIIIVSIAVVGFLGYIYIKNKKKDNSNKKK